MSNKQYDKMMIELEKNLPPEVVETESFKKLAKFQDSIKTDLIDDYEFSRSTYKELIEKANESLEIMIELARDSEHPRAFEVLANLLKTTSDITDRLLKLQKHTRDTQKEDPRVAGDQGGSGNTTNNVFVGSAAELQKLLRDDSIIDV